MNPAITHLNPVMGVDVHIVQPPGPVPPVPIPHPYVGMVFDPADYIPIIGSTVSINGLPRAIAGTTGKPIPSHIPLGGTFIKPPGNEDEDFMGSSTVAIDGDAATYMGLPVLSCQDVGMIPPPRVNPKKKTKVKSMVLPLSVVMPIPAGPPVLIGGPPTISLMALGMRIGMAGLGRAFRRLARTNLARRAGAAFRRGRQRVFRNMRPGFLKCRVLRAEPVDSVTGEVVVDQQDFSIPGRIPIDWHRHYGSHSGRKGVCGHGWETPADARLEIEYDGTVMFQDGTGAPFYFVGLPTDEPVTEPVDGGVLYKVENYFAVQLKENRIFYFPVPTEPTVEIPVELIMDRSGNYLRFFRDTNGLKAIEESAGRRILVTSRKGRIETMRLIHPENNKSYSLVRYAYSDSGDLTAAYDALDVPYLFYYNNHCLIQHTDRKNLSFYYAYDAYNAAGRCQHAWGDGGLYNYHFRFQDLDGRTEVTDSLGYTSIVQYDNRYQIIKEIDANGTTTHYTYDEAGRTTSAIDPLGRKTEWQYDERGNLVAIVHPDGSSIIAEYDKNSGPYKLIDARGNVWLQECDNRGLLIKSVNPKGGKITYAYNQYGDPTYIVDPLGHVTNVTFDRYGHIMSIRNALGNEIRFESDAFGNVKEAIDASGGSMINRYDAKSRIVVKTLPLGHKVLYKYDSEDNLIHYSDEVGNVTQFSYVGLGEIACRHNPDGTSIHYRYDTEERLIEVVNERGESFRFRRDAMGRIIETTNYWGHVQKFNYDDAGQLIQFVDALGRITSYNYDAMGRLEQKQYFDGKQERFLYDSNGNLLKTENENITVERTYDSVNRLIEEVQDELKVINIYDLNGNRICRRSSHDNEVAYQYDDVDNLEAIRINGKQIIQINRDARGLVIGERLSSSLERQFEYTADGLLTHQQLLSEGRSLVDRRYEYDPSGNLTKRIDAAKGVSLYRYDPMGRIVEHVNPRSEVRRFFYDPAGDLLKLVSESIDLPYDRTTEYDGTTYRFDANGNLVERKDQRESFLLDWDGKNRLVSAKSDDGTITAMGYDAQGRRLFKQTDDVKTIFAWDDVRLLSVQIDHGSVLEYVYLPESFEPIAVISDNSRIFYFENDGAGLPHEVYNANGTIIWSATYEAFGAVDELNVDDHANPLRLQGQYYDPEIDLCYNVHRYYDPQLGCFISQDPIGLYGGLNIFSYAPNIWTWIDPLGLACEEVEKGMSRMRIRLGEGAGKVHHARRSIRTQEAHIRAWNRIKEQLKNLKRREMREKAPDIDAIGEIDDMIAQVNQILAD